ncbi:PREDICTED: LOC109786464 isoform [Prunus dulcis]|uniref:PREDICTED: LOC109786464 isoform n=1 Tax=Prunus dulcis TaxID=3755 RepID=A0A5E4FRL7_PRUDU|nr:uncharacterized protein LOC117636900 [Prunus dulcis]KAI5314869.1 hypothetical protein L3X38_044045 [Prunus dulcis]VVA30145.1 PREDICTED: LOC109786464 isoform [Prunus dulcis]
MSSISQSILMALTVTVNKFASSNVQAVHRRQRKDRRKTTSSKAANDFGRRGLLLSAAFATPPVSESGAELLKKYLKKSEENKAKNDKERMDSYYKRNYKDYFEFEEGTIRAKKGELTKSEKGILDWLENNK